MSKVLIKVEDLKQYFPLSSKSLFSKPKYLMANNGINLSIYEGETLGLVGESGCGKSTFGRVLLQLYTQERGNTIYYGRSLYEVKPKYFLKYLNNFEKYRNDFIKLEKSAKEKNSTTKLDKAYRIYRVLARIAGPLYLEDKFSTVKSLLVEEYELSVQYENTKDETLLNKINDVKSKIEEAENKFKDNPKFEELKNFKDYGIDLSMLTKEEMRNMRRDLQIIFQDPYSSLNPRMTIGQIISEALINHKMFKANDPKLEEYIVDTMKKCGLPRHFIHRYPHQFSGGQRQRVGIARALALKPKFIVCDEAVSALDVSIQAQIIELLQKLKEEEKLTYLFISHDLSVINNICDRIGVMYFGNMVELANNYDLFDNTQHGYTKVLLSAIPSMDERQEHYVTESIDDEKYSIESSENRAKMQISDDSIVEDKNMLVEVEPNHYVSVNR